MKTLLALFLSGLTALAIDRVTMTVTVTNLPVTGDTFEINSASRYWTNTFTSTTILTNSASTTNNFIESATTNLWNSVVTYQFSGNLFPQWLTATQFSLLAQWEGALVGAESGGWASFSYSTQTVSESYPVKVPMGNMLTVSEGTNLASLLVTDLSAKSTNQFAPASSALAAFAQKTNGTIRQPIIISPYTTNLTNYGDLRAGTNLYVDGDLYMDSAATKVSFASGNGIVKYDQGSDTMTMSNTFTGTAIDLGTSMKFIAQVTTALEIDNNTGEVISHSNLTSRGTATLTNTVLRGTNQFNSAIGLTASAVTSIADGNNTIAIPDAVTFVTLTGSPTATWTNCAMSGTLWGGRLLILDNATGQNMTIAHESGFDGTAARRIVTSTSADVVTTGRRVTVWIYNSTTARWLLVMGG